MKRKILQFGFILLTIMLIACNGDSENTPDVSHVKIDNQYIRFEKELMVLDSNKMAPALMSLLGKYPAFSNLYFNRLLSLDTNNKEAFKDAMRGFVTNKGIKDLALKVDKEFSDFDQIIKPQITEAFKLMTYYFPSFKAPNVYTYISEYSYQQFLFEDNARDGLGIGLDMFLGGDYPYKEIDPKNDAFSKYITRSFDKAHLPRKIMESLIIDKIGAAQGSRLIDKMIHRGKILYFIEKVLPTSPDSIIMEYTHDQMEWVNKNELKMWAFFFDKNLFYESNGMKINKYINPSPNAPGMPDDAPGRTANYIGLQIVKAFMKKYPETGFQELINMKDAQKIMDKSRYKPRRNK
ncbi:MAG: hypothetical protein V3V14_07075 [Saprospiraceae bacterium]